MSNDHVGGLQVSWQWPGEEPEEVFVGRVRYVRAHDYRQQLTPAASFERLVAVIEGRDPYQITSDGGVARDIERVRAALTGMAGS